MCNYIIILIYFRCTRSDWGVSRLIAAQSQLVLLKLNFIRDDQLQRFLGVGALFNLSILMFHFRFILIWLISRFSLSNWSFSSVAFLFQSLNQLFFAISHYLISRWSGWFFQTLFLWNFFNDWHPTNLRKNFLVSILHSCFRSASVARRVYGVFGMVCVNTVFLDSTWHIC